MESDGVRVSLREYLEAQIARVDEESRMRIEALRDAVRKSEVALDVRLEAMNSIRAQLAAQREEFATSERLESAVTTTRAMYDTLSKSTREAAEASRQANERERAAILDRIERDSTQEREALDVLEKQLQTYMPSARVEGLVSDGRVRWDALVARIEHEGKARDDAISKLQQVYAGLIGRITGMGVIVVVVSFVLQIVFFLATHKFP